MFGNKSHVSSPSKIIRSPAPSSLRTKNNNCLLLIVTIPGWRWIACREEAGGTSRRRYWASLKTSALRLRRASVQPRSGPWLTSAAYVVLLDHAPRVRPRRHRSAFVNKGDTRWDFLGVEPHCLQSIPCYADRSRESGGFLPLRDQSLLHQKQGYNDLCAPPRMGTMRRPIYTPSCSTETMAVLPPMTPRSGTWGGSRAAAVRRRDGWATRGVCLCAKKLCVRSTTRLSAFGLNRCRLRHRCAAISRAQATAAAAVWKKDGFEFLYFAAKTVGCAAKCWRSHKVLE
jgi:hypothetical protein